MERPVFWRRSRGDGPRGAQVREPGPKKPAGQSFNTARFEIRTGPQALFDRVRFKMADRKKLTFRSAQVRQQLADRGVPVDRLEALDLNAGALVAADVRTDTGRFVRSIWVHEAAGQRWWVVLGFGDTVEQVLSSVEESVKAGTVTEGKLYRRVRQVNETLMDAEGG